MSSNANIEPSNEPSSEPGGRSAGQATCQATCQPASHPDSQQAAGSTPSRPQLRDKNGLTEEEFLKSYTPKKYPQPSVTADICVFRHREGRLQLLLVRRGGHPYLGCWATPGGFTNPNETADQAAERELAEETGVQGLALEPLHLYSTPGRDPRGWTMSYAFVALDTTGATVKAGDDAAAAAWFDVRATIDGSAHATLALEPASQGNSAIATDVATPKGTAGNRDSGVDQLSTSFDIVRQAITGIPRAQNVQGSGLAFDHAQIVADAWLLLRYAKQAKA